MTTGLIGYRAAHNPITGGGGGGGTVLFDAVSSANGDLAGSFSWTHTPVSPTPSGVICMMGWFNGEYNTVLTGAKYGGVNFVQNCTLKGPIGTNIDHGSGAGIEQGNYWQVVLLGLPNPPGGPRTVQINFSGLDIYPSVGVITVTGSDLTNIFRATGVTNSGTSTTPTLVIPSATGDMVIDVIAGGSSWSGSGLDGLFVMNFAASPNARRWQQAMVEFTTVSFTTAGSTLTASGASATMGWTKAGDAAAYWLMAGASIKAAALPVATLNLSSNTALDSAAINSVIGTLSVTSGTGTYSYSFVSNPGTLFNISGSSLRVNAPLTAGTDLITVQADNGAGGIVTQAFSIVVSAAGAQAWSTIPVGGGGYVDGIDIAPDGTTIVKSDTHPAPYLKSGTSWLPLQTASSMPSIYTGAPRNTTDNLAVGAWEIRICPNLTTKFYMLTVQTAGKLFVTINSGSAWTELTNFPAQGDLNSNDGYRSYCYRMAVDPQNHAILFIGSVSNGLYRSLDSGVTWTVRTVGTGFGTGGVGMLVAFDPTSAVTSGAKQGLFVGRYGDGVYHSTDGGGTFIKLSTTNMPTTFSNLMVDVTGKLWVVEQTISSLWSWTSGGGWVRTTTPFDGQMHSFDIDPLDGTCQRMAAAAGGGAIITSTNGGTAWNSVYSNNTITGNDAPWTAMHYTGGTYFITDGKIKFDTQVAGKLWQAWGFGLMYAPNVFASTTSVAFTTMVSGIEGLDATTIIHPPSGNPIGAGYDVPIWNFLSYTTAPTEYKPEGYNNGISPVSVFSSRGYALDFAKFTNSGFIASVTGATQVGGVDYRGFYSTDKGVHWLPYADQNPAFWTNAFGSIACSTPSNIVVQTGDATFYTTNGGVNWSACTYAGTNGAYPYSHGQKFVCADPNTANKFLIISPNDGIYRSTNSGQNWTKISSFIAASAGFDQKILGIPGQSNHFLLTGGYLDTATPPQAAGRLYRSTDGGVTWNAISNIGECWCMDYGTTVAGQSYPTIYFAGWANRGSGLEFGVWKTIDNFATFTLIGNTHNPMGWYSLIADIAGDKNIDGACSIAYFGGGFKTFR